MEGLTASTSGRVSAVVYQYVVLAYCLINILFFLSVPPHTRVGAELVANGDFSQGVRGWQLEGRRESVSLNAGVLTLSHPEQDSTVLSQCWDPQALPWPLLLSAEGMSRGVVRGEKSWHESRIDLVGYDDNGEGNYQLRTRLFALEGDQPWVVKSELFQMPADSQRVCLEIAHYSVPGVFLVRHLSLTQGEDKLAFQLGRWLLMAGWLVLAVVLAGPLNRYFKTLRYRRSLMLLGMLVLMGVLIPNDLRQQIEDALLRLLAAAGLPLEATSQNTYQSVWTFWPANWGLSKYAHLLGFALLGGILAGDRQSRLSLRVSALLLLALVTEVVQFFVPMRTPRLSDLVIDAMGILGGMLIMWTVLWLANRRSRSEILKP